MEVLFEAIFNIDSLITNIIDVRAQIIQLQIPVGTSVNAECMFFSFVKTRNIFEEIDKLNSLCKDDQHLRDIMYGLKPLLEIIREYESSIVECRNALLAHYNRDKTGQFKHFKTMLVGWEVPRSMAELDQTYNCLGLLRGILLGKFREGYEAYHHEMHKEIDKEVQEFKKTFKHKHPIIFDDLIKTINDRWMSRGLTPLA